MENLEQQLSQLPKAEISKKADWKIKLKIYNFLLVKNLKKSTQIFLHPHSLWARLALSVLVMFVFLGVTAVYAVNNDHITLGHTFYPLKKTIENIEQQMALTKKAKVETLNKISERRLKEALTIAEHDEQEIDNDVSQKSNNNIEKNIEEALDYFDSAVVTVQKIENIENSKKSREELKDKQEAMVKYLDNISQVIKNKNNEEILKKIDEAKKTIKEYDEVLDDEQNEERIRSKRKNNDDKKNEQKNKRQDSGQNFRSSEEQKIEQDRKKEKDDED